MKIRRAVLDSIARHAPRRFLAERCRSAEGLAAAIAPDSGFGYASYFEEILGDEGNPSV